MPYKVLKQDVMVAADGQPPGSPLKLIPAGTPRSQIPPSERQQLHRDHYDTITPNVPEDDAP